MSVGVMTVGVMSVGEITVGVMTVGVMTVGVMRRPCHTELRVVTWVGGYRYNHNTVQLP